MTGEALADSGHRLGDLFCSKCGEQREASELDRMLWCEFCLASARRTAKNAGLAVGTVLAGGLALWIWLVQKPSDLVIGGWIGTVLAAFYLGMRVGREVVFGAVRVRHRPR